MKSPCGYFKLVGKHEIAKDANAELAIRVKVDRGSASAPSHLFFKEVGGINKSPTCY
jgi:hypothetical protein